LISLNLTMKSEDYQKLFEVQGLRFLVNDIWMTHYKHLEALTIVVDDVFHSYLPKEMVKVTLVKGLDLLSDNDKFEEYKKEFLKFEEELRSYAKELIDKKEVSFNKLEKFLDLISKFFNYYSKTEFFYTDKAYLELSNKKNLLIHGELKNQGRALLNDIFFGKKGYLNIMLKTLEEKFNINSDDLQWYNKKEILDLFLEKKNSEEVINKRKEGFILLGQDNKLKVIIGKEVFDVSTKFIIKEHDKKEVKGIIANKGEIVTGKALVIEASYDLYDKLPEIINNMEKGEILIAETTSPELFLACQKASAIVTNQGGLLSHPAIISREFNIPCIVGTGNVTKIIKTGDLVEVDTNEGIVRKLD
jgi:phosphoenolpyruvate synthase/pyruvate phosphate dikinase